MSKVNDINILAQAMTMTDEEFELRMKYHKDNIDLIKKEIELIKTARKMVKQHFSFVPTDDDKKRIIQILTKFPQLATSRRVETFFWMLKGFSGYEIAHQMNIAIQTVKFNKTEIFRLLGVKTTNEAVAKFHGLPEGIMNERARRMIEKSLSLPDGTLYKESSVS